MPDQGLEKFGSTEKSLSKIKKFQKFATYIQPRLYIGQNGRNADQNDKIGKEI